MENIKPYTKYKTTEISWLGKIPEQWEIRRIKYIFKEQEKRSETGLEDLLSVSHYTGVTKKADKVASGEMISNAKTLVGYKIVEKGDLVINIMLAWNGSLGISKYDGITSPAYCVFKSLIGGERYFGYLFGTKNAQQEFKKQSTGIIDSRLRLYPDKFFNIKSVIPSKEEQDSIANFLDYKTSKIDRFIRKKKQLIKLLNEQKAGAINDVITKGLNPFAEFKPLQIHWAKSIPKHYRLEGFNKNVFLKHGFQFRDYHFVSNGVKIVKISQLSPKGVLNLSKASYVSREISSQFENIKINDGDVLMALTGGTIGKIIRADTQGEILLQNYRVGNFIPNNENLSLDYLYWQLKSNFIQAQMGFYVRETGQPNIGKGDFRKILMIIPPKEEQKEIVSYLVKETKRIDLVISKIQREIEIIEEYKTVIITEAVTGKIDLRDYKVPAEIQDYADSFVEEMDDEIEEEILDETNEEEEL
jgi:type I restriction enzyme S subunit